MSTHETVYDATLSVLREWRKRTDSLAIRVGMKSAVHGSHEIYLRDYLKRLEKEEKAYHQVLYQRFWMRRSAKEIRPTNPDAIYRQQREAINLLASWIIEDEFVQQIAFARERIQTQMGMLPPPSYTKLIGVEQAVDRICVHIVTNASPHITLLTGIGGIGKTAMTDAVVRRVIERGEYEHVVWVRYTAPTMHGRSRQSSAPFDQLMGTIAKLPHIDAESLSETERNKRIMSVLQETPHLIIFDNLEQLEDIKATLVHIPNYVQPSHFVITSRALPPSQESGYVITIPQLDDETSLKLLRHEATSNNVEKITACSDDQLARVIRLVGGNPLALKITVGMARYMPLEQLLTDLQKGQTTRSRNMYQNVYRAAWNALSDDARSTLQGMVLTADSGATAAQIQAFAHIADSGRFWDAIEQLHDRNLLEMRHGERYGIHRLTATFLRTDVLGML